MTNTLLARFICLLCLASTAFAQDSIPKILIIENVRLVSAVGEYQDVPVNIVITDGVVDLMSTDIIPCAGPP